MKFSVIVVSQNRPVWLARCLSAVRQLDAPAFEVIVVADTPSLETVDTTDLKIVAFDTANISAARNLGIQNAAGEICAFIDDDAVPEPLWLHNLQKAFESTQADAVVGYVRGRNGISFQSRASAVDIEGETHEMSDNGDVPYIPRLADGQALKLVGTNMSVRRAALVEVCGFDEALAFFLDDTDLSLRLAGAGRTTAVAPLAEVHHGFAASARRTSLRCPTDLYDVGKSSTVFFRRHGATDISELCDRVLKRERKRLIRHMVAGTCEPKDVRKVLESLREGLSDGLNMELPQIQSDLTQVAAFSPVKSIASGHRVLSSRYLRRKQTLKNAAELSLNRHRCSVFSFSLTPVRHHVRYTSQGVWLQTGGQFGRTERTGLRYRWCRFASRKKEEMLRVAKQRGI